MSSENKNEKDEKFIERSMYEGKSSKNPMLPLLGNLALAVGILAFGIYYYLFLWDQHFILFMKDTAVIRTKKENK